MVLLNFGHLLTSEQIKATEGIIGQGFDAIIDVMVRLDLDQPFQPQIEGIFDSVIGHLNLESESYLINLPRLSDASAVVLAILHGRCGYSPPILRLKRMKDTVPPRYTVAEIVNLQAVRDKARIQRTGLQ